VQSLVPLLVRTFGRTGSTLLMQILGTNERVVFEREYPFEHRYLAYTYQLASVVRLAPDANPDWNNDIVFRGGEPFVAQLPYGSMNMLNKNMLADDLFVSIWEQFSKNMRHCSGIADQSPAYYAEKAPHKVADLAAEVLAGRAIYLLRDPRDQMVSIKSFNQKRGFNSFGWNENDTDITYARKLCQRHKQFMQNILASEDSDVRINVRYEDLIQNGETEVQRISNWLGVQLDYQSAIGNSEIRDVHMTSTDYSASVGRWRSELTDDVKEIFHQGIGSELSELGYSI